MTQLSFEQALEVVMHSIAEVAPDVEDELPVVDRRTDLWDHLELDSMDHQNVMVQLFERTGVDIAERDYPRLRSLEALAEHVAAGGA